MLAKKISFIIFVVLLASSAVLVELWPDVVDSDMAGDVEYLTPKVENEMCFYAGTVIRSNKNSKGISYLTVCRKYTYCLASLEGGGYQVIERTTDVIMDQTYEKVLATFSSKEDALKYLTGKIENVEELIRGND